MTRCHSCGRSIDETDAYARIVLGGQTYVLCCPMCVSAVEAGDFQRRIIAQPFADDRFAARVEYLPALMAGGDYACIRPHGNEQLFVLVADISGHGVTASLVMSRLAAEIERLVDAGTDVVAIAAVLNGLIRSLAGEGVLYLTLFASLIDFPRHAMSYVNCGHPSQLLWSQKHRKHIRLESENVPVGILNPTTSGAARKSTVEIGPGDKLFLFTDGLIELKGEDGCELGEDGVRELFETLVSSPSDKSELKLFERIRTLQNSNPEDDVLVIFGEVQPRLQFATDFLQSP